MTNKSLTIGLVVVAIVAIAGLFTPIGQARFGNILDTFSGDYFNATTGFQLAGVNFFTSSGLKINSTSNTIARINTGQCYFAPAGTTIAASTTKAVDCQGTAAVSANGPSALTGVTSGDNVLVQLATTTAGNTVMGMSLSSCTASSTAGYITCNMVNLTGAIFTWPTTGTASGTASYIVTK